MSKNLVLHEGNVQVLGCDCGGCWGECDTPYVAMTRETYQGLLNEISCSSEQAKMVNRYLSERNSARALLTEYRMEHK